jgi:hypothetical protein
VYVTSWRGGKFNYAGPDIGYVARLTPKGYTPPPVPEFAKLSNAELVKLLRSPSARTRLEAQRTLLRHDPRPQRAALEALASDGSAPLASRVIALFTLKQAFGDAARAVFEKLATDSTLAPFAIRALTDNDGQLSRVSAEPLLVAPGEGGMLEASRTAGLVVLGLSSRWHREGVGEARLRLARESTAPVLLVRRGLRPGGLAPPAALTRFTWSIRT